MLTAETQQQGHHPGRFRRKLQPTRSGQAQAARDLPNDRGKAPCPERILYDAQYRLVGPDVDHALRAEADRCQGGGERGKTRIGPQHRARQPAGDGGDHQGRDGCVLGVRADTHQFVQRATDQPPTRQSGVDPGVTERQHRPVKPFGTAAFEAGDL